MVYIYVFIQLRQWYARCLVFIGVISSGCQGCLLDSFKQKVKTLPFALDIRVR